MGKCVCVCSTRGFENSRFVYDIFLFSGIEILFYMYNVSGLSCIPFKIYKRATAALTKKKKKPPVFVHRKNTRTVKTILNDHSIRTKVLVFYKLD